MKNRLCVALGFWRNCCEWKCASESEERVAPNARTWRWYRVRSGTMGKIIQLEPNKANRCFGCGGANAKGMKLKFELDFEDRRTRGRFALGANYAGGGGFAHGGIIAVVLDEAMGKLSKLSEERAVTAEMSVEYKRPVPVDQEVVV